VKSGWRQPKIPVDTPENRRPESRRNDLRADTKEVSNEPARTIDGSRSGRHRPRLEDGGCDRNVDPNPAAEVAGLADTTAGLQLLWSGRIAKSMMRSALSKPAKDGARVHSQEWLCHI